METMVPVSRRERFMLPWTAPRMMVHALAARLFLLFVLLTALAVLVPSPPVWAAPSNPHGVALIVGNADYEHRDVPDVTFAHRDADAFRRYVVDVLGYHPRNIVDLRDATRRELFDALGTKSDPRSLLWSYLDPEGSSEVVVFYSGHGVPGVNDKRGYLLPVDADPKAAEDDGYPIDLLYRNVGGLAEARSVRVYLDACFSGGSHAGGLIRDASPVFVEATLPEGLGEKVTSLAAASGKQVASWDGGARHGLFTHHLLDALYGKADADGNGEVTAREVKGYLDRYMTRAARRQHRRIQQASLAGASEVVVASAGTGGAFPVRPGLGDTGTASTASVTDAASGSLARADAEVDDGPAPTEEKPLNLTRADKRLVQQGLLEAGTDVSVADGLFGPRTVAAIRAYQKKKGLAETGKLTREQAEALMDLGKEWQAERRRQEEAERLERERQEAARALAEAEEKKRARLAEEQRIAQEAGSRVAIEKSQRETQLRNSHREDAAKPPPLPKSTVSATPTQESSSIAHRIPDASTLPGAPTGPSSGTYTRAGGARYKGEYLYGELHGRGTYTWADGARYKGRFSNGKMHGRGTYTSPDGRAWTCEWRRNAIISETCEYQMVSSPIAVAQVPVVPTSSTVAPAQSVVSAVPGHQFRDCPECPMLVVVPSGNFQMASGHRVTIGEPFAVGVYEVMFSEWDACRREGGCSYNPKDLRWGRSSRPAIRVSWKDAQQYIGWLSTKTGRRYRLLSESEWEYTTRRHLDNSVRRNRENCLACGMERWDNEKTSPVGSFAANSLGLYDVHGNVWEWVEDCWRSKYGELPTDGSAWMSGDEEDCSRRVVRGGLCCDYSPSDLRSPKRNGILSGNRLDYIGFRVARTLD